MDLSALQREFLDDHRVLIGGLRGLVDALEREDLPEARRLAEEIDRNAGGHMAFEEEVFYPRLAEVHGKAFVERLVSEHEAGHRAITTLLASEPDEGLAESDRSGLLTDLRLALDHVMSCGTMLAELGTGPFAAQDEDLDRLRELREEVPRWSSRSYQN